MSAESPHRRRNLLSGEWVVVSPHRSKRPWQGERTTPAKADRPSYQPDCYLCPGNERQGGIANPQYPGTYIFPNDFPALTRDDKSGHDADGPTALFETEQVRGEAHVICYGPDHSSSLGSMDDDARSKVVDSWCDLSRQLGAKWAHVQLFENRGPMMGASSPHPHGQVWASDFIPDIVSREDERQRLFARDNHGQPLLEAVIEAELRDTNRVIVQNDHWLIIVPHWAAWPYETLLVARHNVARLEELAPAARADLAQILGRLLRGYDRVFDCEFPYSMGWHGAPHGLGDAGAHWRLHAHFYPPLLRSASVRKHMVGFELLAETQRDLTPEAAAERLREVMQ